VSEPNQFSLLGERRFLPFFVTQFLGAFNDNIFRNGLVILITFQGVLIAGMDASQLANVAGALFIFPFFIFSAIAGQLADKYEKAILFQRIKLLEIGLMMLAAVAFMFQSYIGLFTVLFLMGCQSTLFGPVKYSYLPQQLANHELVGGNGLVESGTYMAIIFGLVAGIMATSTDGGSQVVIAVTLVSIAVLGYLASLRIPVTSAVDPELKISWNLWAETWRIVGFAKRDKNVFLSILGISWFWFFGSSMTLQVPAYTLETLNGSKEIATLLLVAFAIGVGSGSLLCERMSGHRVELGLVPFGSIGLSLFAIDLYLAQPEVATTAVDGIAEFFARPGSWRIIFDMVMIGVFGGFYSVPLYAMVQERADRQFMSRIIAANNILNALFMVAAAGLAITILKFGFSIPQLFLILAFINALVAAYIYTLLPEFLMRFVVWIIVNVLYRIKTTGRENIPNKGPAVIVCNHISFVDALVLGGSIRRPVRFVMYYKIFQNPLLNFLFRTAKAIPIAGSSEDESILHQAFESIDQELAQGNIVCIFPEGAITRDGNIDTFRGGIEKITARRPVPVIPVGLSGLWGSWFSLKKSGALRRIPGRLFARVDIRIGKPVPADQVSAEGLQMLVRTLRGDKR
jgi:1-acyl-sn-glycerol-3-phosphate acyltransferase